MAECPICKTSSTIDKKLEVVAVDCERCGKFEIENSALPLIEEIFSYSIDAAAKASFALRKISRRNSYYLLTSDFLLDTVIETVLPTPPEQLENLIYFLGESNSDPGQTLEYLSETKLSEVGARSYDNLGFIVESAKSKKLIEADVSRIVGAGAAYMNITNVRLTIDGWAAYLEIKRGKTVERQAFMAMKFGDSVLDDIYKNHFKAAVRDTGFDLKRLDEGQRAGLIDDQLRVQIRKSRFLIADLTHHNNGAYWEAGYAEGLGKDVIYTCRKDVFEDKENTTHFDANHHLTVTWEHDKIEDAVKRLKATIRATLPEDATMEDSMLS